MLPNMEAVIARNQELASIRSESRDANCDSLLAREFHREVVPQKHKKIARNSLVQKVRTCCKQHKCCPKSQVSPGAQKGHRPFHQLPEELAVFADKSDHCNQQQFGSVA
jgi:hypothetical protein